MLEKDGLGVKKGDGKQNFQKAGGVRGESLQPGGAFSFGQTARQTSI